MSVILDRDLLVLLDAVDGKGCLFCHAAHAVADQEHISTLYFFHGAFVALCDAGLDDFFDLSLRSERDRLASILKMLAWTSFPHASIFMRTSGGMESRIYWRRCSSESGTWGGGMKLGLGASSVSSSCALARRRSSAENIKIQTRIFI